MRKSSPPSRGSSPPPSTAGPGGSATRTTSRAGAGQRGLRGARDAAAGEERSEPGQDQQVQARGSSTRGSRRWGRAPTRATASSRTVSWRPTVRRWEWDRGRRAPAPPIARRATAGPQARRRSRRRGPFPAGRPGARTSGRRSGWRPASALQPASGQYFCAAMMNAMATPARPSPAIIPDDGEHAGVALRRAAPCGAPRPCGARCRRRRSASGWRAAGRCRPRRRGPGRPGEDRAQTRTSRPVPTRPQGSAPASTPSMTVFISVACGAGRSGGAEGVGAAEEQHRARHRPAGERGAEELAEPAGAPGVAPTSWPVFRSCEMSPALEAAMQTTVPTVRIAARAAGSVQPRATKTTDTPSSVTSVMPEVGFEETPIRPTMRDDTTTKASAEDGHARARPRGAGPRSCSRRAGPGTANRVSTTATGATSTTQPGMSRSVRGTAPPSAATSPPRRPREHGARATGTSWAAPGSR